MTALTHHDPMTIQSSRVQDAVVETTDLLSYEQAITEGQLEALGRLHGVATFEIARSLATAELIRAGREKAMSPTEQAAYQQLDAEFLVRVSEVTRLFSEKVVRLGIPRLRQ
jgi:hypothetical protein